MPLEARPRFLGVPIPRRSLSLDSSVQTQFDITYFDAMSQGYKATRRQGNMHLDSDTTIRILDSETHVQPGESLEGDKINSYKIDIKGPNPFVNYRLRYREDQTVKPQEKTTIPEKTRA